MSFEVFTDEPFLLEKEPLGSTVDIDAEFTRYIYEHNDGNFCIIQFTTNRYEDFVVTGNVPFSLHTGRSYELTGEITERENNFTGVMERQLKLQKIKTVKPNDEFSIIKFLSAITGLRIANDIYMKYGDESIDTLSESPEQVSKDFKGVSLDVAYSLKEEIDVALGEVSEAFPFLQSYRFSDEEVKEMVNRYGENIKAMVEDNPYILMNYLDGFPGASFTRCDTIAKDIGFDLKDRRRTRGGLEHVLVVEGQQGHVYYYPDNLMKDASRLLNKDIIDGSLSLADIQDVVDEMTAEKLLRYDKENNYIYLAQYYYYESMLAFNMVALLDEEEWVPKSKREKLLALYLEDKGIELEDKQWEAVINMTDNKGGIGVINGGAGTGKTFTVKILLDFMKIIYMETRGMLPYIQLMAPTGKAAKVMKAATGLDATTIHRGLMWTPDGFTHNEANPLPGDIIVIDEASMLDTSLAFSLTNAIAQGTKLVFLGDPNQLPSIGPGNVLHDIVDSERFDTVTLDVTKRQEDTNQVGINGRLIAKQEIPVVDSNKDDPKAIIKTLSSPKDMAEQAMLALEYLLSKGLHPDDIQIITPGRKGFTGVYNLNMKLQHMMNPNPGEKEILNRGFNVNGVSYELKFKIKDRVMHTANTDELDWVILRDHEYENMYEDGKNELITNGEMGRIVDIFEEEYITQSGRKQNRDVIIVEYDDGLLKYKGNEKGFLDHAYAMTIHKSQGSQWPAVIQLISTEHYIMLDNSLLYTGYTRAEEYQVLLTNARGLQKSLHERKVFDRRTTLKKFIIEENI